MKKLFFVGVAMATLMTAAAAQAGVSGLYNTGEDVVGGVDQYWTITAPTAQDAYDTGSLAGGWVPNTADSAWITNTSTGTGSGLGDTYGTTFTATAGQEIKVNFAADNQATFYLNGAQVFAGDTDPTNSPWSYWETFTFTAAASDVLTVVVPNNTQVDALTADGPTGLQVQFAAVPEPSTWAMMGIGFVGLAFAGYRARRSAVSIA